MRHSIALGLHARPLAPRHPLAPSSGSGPRSWRTVTNASSPGPVAAAKAEGTATAPDGVGSRASAASAAANSTAQPPPTPRRHAASNILSFISESIRSRRAMRAAAASTTSSSSLPPAAPPPPIRSSSGAAVTGAALAAAAAAVAVAAAATAPADPAPQPAAPPPASGPPPPEHPTMALLLKRWREGSMPGHRTDDFKLGLAVEGGGMRGIISGAMLMVMHGLGMRNAFDAVYGASAGAINAAFFLTGQPHGLDIYIQHLTGDRFINFTKFFRGGLLLDVTYLIDDVMRNHIKLDWKALMDCPVPLKCVTSNLDSLKTELIGGFTSEAELVETLKATANVPGVAGPPRVVRGHRLVDAAVFEPVPTCSAIRDGCTHVMVLCTKPAEPNPPRGWRKSVGETVTYAVKQALMNQPYMKEAWKADVSIYQQHDELLNVASQLCPDDVQSRFGAYILPVQPVHTAGCHSLCTDPIRLQLAIDEGRIAMELALSGLDGPLRVQAPAPPAAVAAVGEAAAGRLAAVPSDTAPFSAPGELLGAAQAPVLGKLHGAALSRNL